MRTIDRARLLRLHFCESDRAGGRPLYEAVVERCRELGIAGATVFRGMEGFGESAELHRRHFLRHDEPVLVTIVDTPEAIARLIPELERLMDTGMMAASDVETIRLSNRER